MADLRMIFGDYRRQKQADAQRAEHARIVNEALYAQPQTASDGSGMGPPTAGGLLQDPSSLQNQLRFAGALEGSPLGGGGLLGSLVQGEQRRGTIAEQLFQSDVESQRREASAGQNRQLQSEIAAVDAFLKLRGQNQNESQFQRELAAQPAGGGVPMGSTPSGYVPRFDSAGQFAAFAPATGTPDWIKEVETGQANRNAVKAWDAFDTMMESSGLLKGGTELAGPNAAVYRALREDLIAQVGELQNKNVLQEAERNALEEILPDPTSVGAKFRFNKSIREAYGYYRDRQMQRLSDWRLRNQWLPDNPVALQGPGQ